MNKEKIIQIAIWIIKFIALVLLLIAGYALLLYIINNISNEISKTILDYITVIIWPIVVLIIMILFKRNIADFIGRMEEWEFLGLGKGKAYNPQQKYSETTVNIEDTANEEYKKIIEEKESEITNLQDNKKQLLEKLTNAQIEVDFERIYNYIFASQIDFLWKINGFNSVELLYAMDHLKKVQQANKGFLMDWKIPKYLGFLIESGLIKFESSNNRIEMTPKGKAFLSYLSVRNYKKYGL